MKQLKGRSFKILLGVFALLTLFGLLLMQVALPALGAPLTDSSAPFAISTAADDEYEARVAYNTAADEYLVVWTDNPNSLHGVYGQRVSADGMLLGSSFLIPGSDNIPAVVYNSVDNEYLVVFGANLMLDVYAQRVAADGSLIGGEFAIRATAHAEAYPRVAYNPATNQYLVTWGEIGYQGNSTWSIVGQIVNADGSLSGTDFGISTTSSQPGAEVAYSPSIGEYVMVMTLGGCPGSSSNPTYSRQISADGTLVGSPVFITSESTCTGWHLTYNSVADEFLYVWSRWANDPTADVLGQRLAADGSPLGSPITVSDAPGPQSKPRVAHNATENQYYVVWIDDRDGSNREIYGQALASDGTLVDSVLNLSEDTNVQYDPFIVSGSSPWEFLVTWADNRNGTDFDVFGALVDISPLPTPTPTATDTPTPTPTNTSTPTGTPSPTPEPTLAPIAIAGTSLDASGLLELNGSLSTDPDGTIVGYSWQIMGEADPRTGQVVSIADLPAGDYMVDLTVVDDDGVLNTDTMLLGIPVEEVDTIPPARPNAQLNENPAGTDDTVSGNTGDVEGLTIVEVFSDAGLTALVGSTTANADGSFTPVSIGNNAFDEVFVTATDEAGNQSMAQILRNDREAPIVTTTFPDSDEEDVRRNVRITITFSELMDAASTEGAFSISPSVVARDLGVDGKRLTFVPESRLPANTTFTITIDTGATDQLGNPLSEPYVFTFTTGNR